jgi:acetylornithine deacetylase/succinyl-diaminopimelate desuccinylase-like protein
MKGTCAVHVTLLRLLKRLKVPLKRDVILLAVADEEAGGTGALSIIKDHPDLIRGAEFLLNEGDVPYVKNGKLEQYGVDVMEKAALWLRMTAKGPAGHGSIPSPKLVCRTLAQCARTLETLGNTDPGLTGGSPGLSHEGCTSE